MASIRSNLWRVLLASSTKRSLPLPELRRQADAYASALAFPEDVEIRPVCAAGLMNEWLIPPGAPERRCLLYLHGGAYVMGSRKSHRRLAAQIARASGTRVLLLDYRLAPECPFPAALDDALAACRWLQQHGFDARNIAIAGDSAGGGLALATLVALRDAQLPLPALFVGISPWTDLTCSGESITTRAKADPWLTRESLELRRHYTAESNYANPLVSPLFADLRGLPPMLLHAGGDELLLSDTTRLADTARTAGVKVELKVWPRMWHGFHALAPHLPEANRAIGEIGAYVRAWGSARQAAARAEASAAVAALC